MKIVLMRTARGLLACSILCWSLFAPVASVAAPTYSNWSAVYAGAGAEEMEGLTATADGGFIVSGSTDSWGDTANGDAWVVKLDAYGAVQWQKTYGGSGDEALLDIKQTSTGEYVAAGWTKSFGEGKADLWVVKLDAFGAVQWQYSYGGPGNEQAWSVELCSDGSYLIAGGTTSFGAGKADYWVLKLDASGTPLWQKTYGGPKNDGGAGSYPEYVVRAFEDADGHYVVASESYSFGSGASDIWVLQLDSDGNIVWQAAYGGFDEDSMWTFAELAGGGYVVPGSTVTFSPDYSGDMWVLALDTAGQVSWQRVFGVAGQWDEVLTVAATSDGGSLIGGYVEQAQQDWDMILLRLDASGNSLWSKYYEYGWDWPNAMIEAADGSLVVAGVAWPRPADLDLWVMRLDGNGGVGSSCPLVHDMTLISGSSAVAPVSSNALAQDSNAVPRVTSATSADSSAAANFLCQAQAVEDCGNSLDDDGDGLTDCSDPDCTDDADGDGYVEAPCGADCNDDDAAINPSAAEQCDNLVDDDCSGAADCADAACAPSVDGDADGYFGGICGDDCDDHDAAIHPGAAENCSNTLDDDCDAAVDCGDTDCQELALCALSSSYAKGSSSLKFNLSSAGRDRANLKTCVNQDLCTSLAAAQGNAAVSLSLQLAGCSAVSVTGDALASKRSGTIFKAGSDSSALPAYSFKANCRKMKAVTKLRRADLASCAANPVVTTLAAPGTRRLQSQAVFDERRNRAGQLKGLRHIAFDNCTP